MSTAAALKFSFKPSINWLFAFIPVSLALEYAHVPEPVTGPVSPVTPAEPSEPVPTSDSVIAYGLMVLVLFLSIMLA